MAKFKYYNGSAWIEQKFNALDSDKLGGQLPSYYALATHGHTDYAPVQIISSSDFNSMLTPGLYTMRASSTNSPSGGSYHSLLVMKSDNGNYVQQLAIKESSNEMFMRYYNGSWSSWNRIMSTGTALYTVGDLFYANSTTTLTRLAKGTAGQVLTMNSGATAPTWATPTGGSSPTFNSNLVLLGSRYGAGSINIANAAYYDWLLIRINYTTPGNSYTDTKIVSARHFDNFYYSDEDPMYNIVEFMSRTHIAGNSYNYYVTISNALTEYDTLTTVNVVPVGISIGTTTIYAFK